VPLVGIALIVAGCMVASCRSRSTSDVGPDGRADAPVPDSVRVDSARDRGSADLPRPRETAADRGRPDIGSIDPQICGGSRTLTPTPVSPYTALPYSTHCSQVTFGGSLDLQYEVHGDLLVYSVYVPNQDRNAFYVDLKTDKEWRIHQGFPSGAGLNGCRLVSTDGQTIGYSCVRDGWQQGDPLYIVNTITRWDPKTLVETDTHCVLGWPTSTTYPVMPAAIGMGPRGIVWELFYKATFFDGTKAPSVEVSAGGKSVGNVHMNGDRIVWSRLGQIEVYDVKAQTTKVLDATKTWQCHPRIDGNKVVWTDFRNSKNGNCLDWYEGDIYVHDLSTGVTSPVTTHAAQQAWPDVGGEWVAWLDYRHNPNPNPGALKPKKDDVYAKNLKTGEVVRVTDGSQLVMSPKVANGYAFFAQLDAQKKLSVFKVDLAARAAASSGSQDAGVD
jgi:hypothetical protein